MRPPIRSLLALLLFAGSGCGRTHSLEEGPYVFTVTTADRERCKAIAKTFGHFALHYPIPEWRGLISGLAYPLTPAEIERGPVFRFNLNHVVVPGTPFEMFRTEHLEL